jgi:dihydrofolate synthase / folylpolyglutamate synthase
VKYGDLSLLIDGAHNPAAAQALRQYADTLEAPVTWVMGILTTKDHKEIFTALLRSGDCLHLVPVPDHSSADPLDLAVIARTICPNLATCETYDNLFAALKAVKCDRPVILCGSLYLVGYFLKSLPSP